MKRLFLGALMGALLALSGLAGAQSIAYTIPVKGPLAVVAPQRLGTLHALPFVGDIEIALLPGFAASNTAPAIGVALYRAFPAGPDLDVQLGVHFVAVQGVPASGGLFLGLGWRLGT